jgi:hypothetical protein
MNLERILVLRHTNFEMRLQIVNAEVVIIKLQTKDKNSQIARTLLIIRVQ